MDSGPLRLLPPLQTDRGSGRVRLGPGLMAELGLGLGDPVLVQLAGGRCLGWAWPRADRAEGLVQLDRLCCCPGLLRDPDPDPGRVQQVRVQPLCCPRLQAARVTVLVRTGTRTGPGLLHELVRDLLRGKLLHRDFVVDLRDWDTEVSGSASCQLTCGDPVTSGDL